MNAFSLPARRAILLALGLALGSVPGLAAVTLSQQVDTPEINLDQTANVTITIQNGSAQSLQLPHVDGLQVVGTYYKNFFNLDNGVSSSTQSVTFTVMGSHPGDFIIPAFDVTTDDGTKLHVHEIKIHVLNTMSSSPSNNSNAAQAPGGNAPFNPSGGDATAPPNNPAPGDNTDNNPAPNGTPNNVDGAGNAFTPPRDSTGHTAKVFLYMTAKTTDAYVGEAIPVRIEFYIRNDVYTQQDSIPTMDGSDFLMNDLSTRLQPQNVLIDNEDYIRFSWNTAIEAPKSGDFPLQVDQDSYWVKSVQTMPVPNDPFGMFSMQKPILAHENISSNKLTIHVQALPEEGRPANFTGAIGQFRVTADATPDSVDVGDPVQLQFTVAGEGNFPYAKCPALAPDPNWKTYASTSKVEYENEAHTEGTKTFSLSVIPEKNGLLQLPAASFSYFSTATKQYVTVPVTLPAINVTGRAPVVAASAPAGGPDSSADTTATNTAPAADQYLPNHLEIGALRADLLPAYRKTWFWTLQGGLGALVLAGLAFSLLRPGPSREEERAEQARRRRSLGQEQDAMHQAVRQNDARAFFLAARHAVQLHLGAQWRLKPEAITLAEVRERDPELAAALEPIFAQTDEIIYSGGDGGGPDLAQWETRVRECLHQLQPA